VTIDDIANYCEVKDCQVSLGSAEAGYIRIDGNGLMTRDNNYRRFLALREMASLPNPTAVLAAADAFTVDRGVAARTLGRADFESELRRFQELVGA
jgi:hypothetical protein